MSKRYKTKYPGVFYREAKRIGAHGTEKVYYVVFKKDGKVHEEKVGRQYQDDMTPARAARIRAARIEGKRLSRKEKREKEKERYTIDMLWDLYKASRPQNKALVTDTSRYLKYIQPALGRKEPQKISPLDTERIRLRLSKRLAPQTVKHVLNLLTQIVNYGVKNGLCSGLTFHVKKPKVDNAKTENLTPEQLQNLLKAIEQDTHPDAGDMMLLALYTGMRRGELFSLKWHDIEFEGEGFIHIRNPKGGKAQVIPLNDAAREVLHNRKRTSPYVFPGRGGGRRATISAPVNHIKAMAGLPKDFRPLHGLRHVYASLLASSGKVDMYILQKLLTHKSPKMTQRYAHLQDETLRRASNLAGEIIENMKPLTALRGGKR